MADSDNLRAKVKEDVIRIMSETLEISPEEITSELQFNTDLPFDSLQLYEFVMTLRRHTTSVFRMNSLMRLRP